MTQIKVDYDHTRPPSLARMLRLLYHVGLHPTGANLARSRSGHWHARFQVSGQCSPGVICALQCLLGSDPQREMFNVLRIIQLERHSKYISKFWKCRWNVLYDAHDIR